MTTIDGFIYKIYSTDNKMNYYGYTTKDIHTRFKQHLYDYIRYNRHTYDPDQIVNTDTSYNNYITPDFNNTQPDKVYCTSYEIFTFYPFDQIKIDIVEHMQNTTLDKIKNKEKYYIQHFPCVNKMSKKKFRTYYSLSSKFITLDQLEKDIPILQHPDTHIHHIIHILGYHIDTHNHLKLIQQVSFYNIKIQLLNAINTYYPDIHIHTTTITELLTKTNTLLKKYHLEIITYKTFTKKGKYNIVDYDLLLLSYQPISQEEVIKFLEQLTIQKQKHTS